MSINNKNIDQWLFDYYEGNLSPAEVKQLELFLKKNPEYYEDATAWKDSFVEESVPAFDTSMLVKEVTTTADHKRFALVSLAILLMGGLSAIYFTTSNGNTTSVNAASGKNSNGTHTTTVHTAASNNQVHHNNVSTGNHGALNSNTISNSNTLSYNNNYSNYNNGINHPAYNSPVVNNNGNFNRPAVTNSQTLNRPNNGVINNVNQGNTQVLINNNSQINNVLANNNSSNSVTNNQQNSYLAPNQHTITLVTNNSNTSTQSATVLASNEQNKFDAVINSIAAGIAAAPSSLHAVSTPVYTLDDIKPIEVNEMVESSSAEISDINITLEDKTDATAANSNSEPNPLNPNNFTNKKDGNKSSEIVDKPKTGPGPGHDKIGFGNLRNVTLLQGINNEFETNASLITQHYRGDGYAGANYRMTSSGESFMRFVGGYSATMRKYRTTINGYGHYTTTNAYTRMGVGLQAAMNLKLNRFSYLIPSLSAAFDQYSFNNLNIWNCIPGPVNTYFGSELLGKQTNYSTTFANSNQFNVNAGLFYHHKKYYAGISFNGLAQPKFRYVTENSAHQQMVTNTASVNVVIGTDFISKDYPELSMSPQVIMEIRNMEPIVTGGSMVRYRGWSAGAGVSTKGALNTFIGYSHRVIGFQYRFMFDKVDAQYGTLSGHYLTTHINIKGLAKKQKAILDEDK